MENKPVQREKIAFVIHGISMGGAEKFLITLSNYFYENGYSPVLIILSEQQDLINELNPCIKTISVIKRNRFDLSISNKIRNIIDEQGIKRVFCINTYAFFFTKLALLFKNDIRIFLSPHSTIPVSNKVFLLNFLYYRFLTKNDTVVFLCQNQKSYLERKYMIPESIQKIVYNGIDTEYFNPERLTGNDKEELYKKFNITQKDKVIVQVARLSTEKRHMDAIDALDILHKRFKNNAHLILVGKGEFGYTRKLKDYAIEKDLYDYIHFEGNQSDVRKYYSISDVFTLTSNSETFSLAALEAMAFGVPCSLTDVGGANEMIMEGVSGKLCEAENTISIANSWNDLLNSNLKGNKIRQYILDNFSSKKMLDQYLQLID